MKLELTTSDVNELPCLSAMFVCGCPKGGCQGGCAHRVGRGGNEEEGMEADALSSNGRRGNSGDGGKGVRTFSYILSQLLDIGENFSLNICLKGGGVKDICTFGFFFLQFSTLRKTRKILREDNINVELHCIYTGKIAFLIILLNFLI